MGFLNPAFYGLAQSSNYGAALHDVTTGNNTSTASPSRFYAAPGYDLCTGWGTPIGSGLINALAGAAAPSIASNSLTLTLESCTNGAVDPGETVTVQISLKNTGGAPTTNLIATLQASGGVSSPGEPQVYGLIPSGATASNTASKAKRTT